MGFAHKMVSIKHKTLSRVAKKLKTVEILLLMRVFNVAQLNSLSSGGAYKDK